MKSSYVGVRVPNSLFLATSFSRYFFFSPFCVFCSLHLLLSVNSLCPHAHHPPQSTSSLSTPPLFPSVHAYFLLLRAPLPPSLASPPSPISLPHCRVPRAIFFACIPIRVANLRLLCYFSSSPPPPPLSLAGASFLSRVCKEYFSLN
jgi:hypothetical protein